MTQLKMTEIQIAETKPIIKYVDAAAESILEIIVYRFQFFYF
jgi:hypothetical protein